MVGKSGSLKGVLVVFELFSHVYGIYINVKKSSIFLVGSYSHAITAAASISGLSVNAFYI